MRAKAGAFLCILLFLCGCQKFQSSMDAAYSLRDQLINSDGCSFQATVTADYSEKLYAFTMECQTDRDGNLHFTVTQPETIAGITGQVSAKGGNITFDDRILAFQTIADGQVSPVSAPWLLVNTLRSGYLKACAATDSGMEISIDDSYGEEPLHLKVITQEQLPTSAEIFWQGRRVLTVNVEKFAFL